MRCHLNFGWISTGQRIFITHFHVSRKYGRIMPSIELNVRTTVCVLSDSSMVYPIINFPLGTSASSPPSCSLSVVGMSRPSPQVSYDITEYGHHWPTWIVAADITYDAIFPNTCEFATVRLKFWALNTWKLGSVPPQYWRKSHWHREHTSGKFSGKNNPL